MPLKIKAFESAVPAFLGNQQSAPSRVDNMATFERPHQETPRLGMHFFSAKYHGRLFACRMCWRISLTVLCSIFLVEAVILLPSLRNYERDLLTRVQDATVASVATSVKIGRAHV